MVSRVVVVDYGMGNLWSVASALQFLGAECVVSGEPGVVQKADILILPGVGSYRRAMEALHERRLVDSVKEAVERKQRKILGICLGMQLMADWSTEDGKTQGFGFISGQVERFSIAELSGNKVPHIGFNSVEFPSNKGLFAGFGQEADFYFVHSYRLSNAGSAGEVAMCRYDAEFVAGYQSDNVFAVQFHPEKSQTNGLQLLKNFLIL